MVLVPIARISASTSCLAASPTTTIDTTDAIPMMIPSMVSRVRILLAAIASRPWSAPRENRWKTVPSRLQQARLLWRGRSGRTRRRVAHQLAVVDLDNALSLRRHLRIVSHDNDRVPLIAKLMEDRHHLFTGMAVERSGGFIGGSPARRSSAHGQYSRAAADRQKAARADNLPAPPAKTR